MKKKAKKQAKAKTAKKKRRAPGKFKVRVIESERGWGMSSEIVRFYSEKSAKKYVHSINSKNTAPAAPDWYMSAEYLGKD